MFASMKVGSVVRIPVPPGWTIDGIDNPDVATASIADNGILAITAIAYGGCWITIKQAGAFIFQFLVEVVAT